MPILTLSSEDFEVFGPIWAEMVFHEGDWIMLLKSSQGNAITVARWDRSGEFQEIAALGPREGISYIQAHDIDVSGRLAVKGMLTPSVLSIDLNRPEQGFQRFGAAPVWGNMIFWDRDHLLGTSQELRVECIGCKRPQILSEINDMLPEDTWHPSLTRENLHKMLIARDGPMLALGYSLYPQILIFSLTGGQPVKQAYPIRFPGYLKAPETFPGGKNPLSPARKNYADGFHRLLGLHWFKNECYAQLQKGYDGYGVWVKVQNAGEDFVWDNNSQSQKIVAMGGDEIVFGKVEESAEGMVKWRLWRVSFLPSS